MHCLRFLLLSFLFNLLHLSAGMAEETLSALASRVEQFQLSNGLRVVLYHRPVAPVFSGQTWVRVGSVDEVAGLTGASHLLEHMAFKGTEIIGTSDYAQEKPLLARYEALMDSGQNEEAQDILEQLEVLWIDNEFGKLYTNRGAVGLNAGTGKDFTFYTVALPSSAFEFWCWMESDRLLNPVFRQYYQERDVVMEERRMRFDDDPAGKLYEQLIAIAFIAHPNRLPVIGWASDIEKLTASDIRHFYDTYYRPDNMVISLVGDITREVAEPLLERYFGRIPRAHSVLPEIRTVEPKQQGERRVIVRFDAQPRLIVSYHKPAYPDKDDLYFAVMHALLSDGRSSLLQRILVEEKQLAASVHTSEAPGELFPSVFYIYALPKTGVSNETLLAEIQQILDTLKTRDVDPELLEAAKRRLRVGFLRSLASNGGLARLLGKSELLWNDWKVLLEMYQTMLDTTADDVKRLAQSYFDVDNRTVAFLEPR